MFSRNRDEAFGMRWRGRLSDAYRLLYVSPELCNRLTYPLLNVFGAVSEHARHFATAPNLAPLDAGYFRSIRGQRTALLNEFFGTVLLTRRSQFLHKIHALARLVADLGESFRAAAERLGADGSVRPDRKWVAWTPYTMT